MTLLVLLLGSSRAVMGFIGSQQISSQKHHQQQLILQSHQLHSRSLPGIGRTAFTKRHQLNYHSETTSAESHSYITKQSEVLHKGAEAHITIINSAEDLDKFLAIDDRLCVIKFHASWCKSCQKFGLKFRKLAVKQGDWINHQQHNKETLTQPPEIVHDGLVRFGSLEFGANKELCRSMGIKRLPTVQIYNGDQQLVSSFACGPSKFPLLLAKLDKYMSMSAEELRFEADMAEGASLITEDAKVSSPSSSSDAESSSGRAKPKMNSDNLNVATNWWDRTVPGMGRRG